MKYVNANSIFPEDLLKEIQKYITGELIYVPKPDGERKGWGECSGSRMQLKQRNMDIQTRFKSGLTINQLSEEFCLSYDSIKKIVYCAK